MKKEKYLTKEVVSTEGEFIRCDYKCNVVGISQKILVLSTKEFYIPREKWRYYEKVLVYYNPIVC